MKTSRGSTLRLILWLTGYSTLALSVQATIFTTDTIISATDTNYDGLDLVVTNCTLTVDGAHTFASLQILNGGTLTHPQDSMGLNLAVAADVSIAAGGTIDVDARGYDAGLGPGSGSSRGSPASGSGAGHGGLGGLGSSNTTSGGVYGSILEPTALGSTGGTGAGGAGGKGGGVVRLVVGGTLRIDGSITANGANATNSRAGGGSGGSVWLSAQTISGTGSLSANGGAGEPIHGGGGGGGRIATYFTTNSFSGTTTAQAGTGFVTGGAGTIYTRNLSQPVGHLLVDNGGRSGAHTPLAAPDPFDLTLRAGAKTTAVNAQSIRHLLIASNSWFIVTNQTLSVTGEATIASSGGILANGTGLPSGQGAGAGGTSSPGAFGITGGGGGHGGFGAASGTGANGGNSHGVLVQPQVLGSGGGRGNGNANAGGAGGGAIRLNVTGTLWLDGDIAANGTEGLAPHSGGGSGGSVWITVGALNGSGVISANGGAGNGLGGGGGGGRVAVHYTQPVTNGFAGSLTAHGGDGGTSRGGAGTVFIRESTPFQDSVIVDNGGVMGTNTTLGSFTSNQANLGVTGGATLHWPATSAMMIRHLLITTNATLLVTNAQAIPITVLSNATIQAGGVLHADGSGNRGGRGLGYGRTTNSTLYGATGGGAGYGGIGGAGAGEAAGGIAYGSSLSQPTEIGSGGASVLRETGGAGGGAIRLNVAGTLLLDGRISANGQDAPGLNCGGGSGGSVWLSLGRLTGSGSITANGGGGNNHGGGGAGGRIAVTYATNLFSGAITAHGGGGAAWGGAGTVYTKANHSPTGQVVLENAGRTGATALVGSSGSYHLTIGNGVIVPAPYQVSLAGLLIAANGRLTFSNQTSALTINGNVVVEPGALLTADGAGSPAGSGPGAGMPGTASGAGHGGNGIRVGTATGSAAHGIAAQSLAAGSGGGSASGNLAIGGAGGGIIRLNVTGELHLDGEISANGAAGRLGSGTLGLSSAGGGSGGSIWLTVGAFSGSGRISAHGGAGFNAGGGGGGGRIAVHYQSNAFTGSIQTFGGASGPSNPHGFAGAGTIYRKATSDTVAQVWVDNGGRKGTNTLFSDSGVVDLTVREGGVLSRNGSYSFRNLEVGTNGWLLLTNQLVTASNATVLASGGIIADGTGYGPSQGHGAGRASQSGTGSGAGHGGYGAASHTAGGGNAYDLAASPTMPGSGGGLGSGTPAGGAGGGVVRLSVAGWLYLDGRISADGETAISLNGGGGAGGSVWLTVGGLSGSGFISANGGAGSNPGGGGGGGGRIAVRVTSSTFGSNHFTGTYTAWGGASGSTNPMRFGGAGTIYLTSNNRSDPDHILADNGGRPGTNTLVSDSGSFDIIIRDGAIATFPSQYTSIRNLLVASNGWLAAANQFVNIARGTATIEAGGGIIADRAGFAPGQGLGAGSSRTSATYGYTGGGGGHGGPGAPSDGGAPGGNANGVVLFPYTGSGGFPGSGGGGNPASSAGAGGGIVRLTAAALHLDGRISADGGHGIYQHGGGGAGGSISLDIGTLAGSGIISACGGDGNGVGGGGGGGRIAIACSTNQFVGAMRAWGGLGGGGAGGAGTIYFKTNSLPLARVLVDNGGWPGMTTPLQNIANIGLTVKNGGVVAPIAAYLAVTDLRVDPHGSLTGSASATNLDLIVYSNAVIAANGAVSVDGQGFAQGQGAGAGFSSDEFGSGAGHGGAGGASATMLGGFPYGSLTQPSERGSGGGFGFGPAPDGSVGGGALRLRVGGTLTVNGRLSADGQAGWQDSAGGGSGGSLWVTAGAFNGTGQITADGGTGEWFGGGGGGGGRIAIYYRTSDPANRFTGRLSAFGGEGFAWGEDGSVLVSSAVETLQVISQSPAGVVSNAVNSIEVAFNLPVNSASFSGADYTITTPSRTLFGTNLTRSLIAPDRFRILDGLLTEPGEYTLRVGPDIEDFYGRPMSQVYTSMFILALPTIEGTIMDAQGQPVPGVLLQDIGLSPAVSDANGHYRVGFVAGSHLTLTPAKEGLMFVPRSRSYAAVTTTLTNQDFLAVDTIAPHVTATIRAAHLFFGWHGYSGVRYQLLGSTNLVDWVPFGSGVVGSNALIQLPVPVAGEPMQFFRVRADN
ncbi:MAG: hypothetical protein KIS67_04670 [Verrucomicrobiae bacterium]|nr:hypothetical protein [Verrucomicrobiae bacterium]